MGFVAQPADQHIAAPPEVVYDVLADFQRYPQWTDALAVRGGPPVPGSRVLVLGKVLPGPPTPVPCRVERAERGVVLDWTGRLGVLTLHHLFELRAQDGGTVVRHLERFEGPAARLLRGAQPRIEAAYATFNAALAERAATLTD